MPSRVYADGSPGGLVARFGMAIGKLFMFAAHYVFFAIHLAMNALSFRDGQRAEYYADAVAAKLAGPAAASMLEVLVRAEVVQVVIGGRARSGAGFATWRAAASEARKTDSLARSLQLSVREETSAFATHPPTGLRHRLLSSQSAKDPAVVLTAARAERIDAELLRFEKRYVNDIAYAW